MEANAGELLAVKNRLAKIDTVAGVTLAHFACLAVAQVLRAQPKFNRVWGDGEARQLQSVDVGIVGPGGIMVIAKADQLRLGGLVAASQRTDGPRDGGAITVTMAEGGDVTRMGVSLAPDRAAALGLGTIRSVFRPDANGKPVLAQELGLVLTCNSRVFDAESATAFLNAIKASLENPLRLLAS
jgi:pyruvate dehydrogenase E2 component (dihydrolipoamide acetyltransferase)